MTPEQLDEARQLIVNGSSYAEVAERFSVTYEIVFAHFSTTGIHKQMRRERNDRIFAMVMAGKSTRSISEEIGMSFAATERIVRSQRRYAPYL